MVLPSKKVPPLPSSTPKPSPSICTKVKGWGATCSKSIAQAWKLAIQFKLSFIFLFMILTVGGIDVCMQLLLLICKENVSRTSLQMFYMNKLWGNFLQRVGFQVASRIIASIFYCLLYGIGGILLWVQVCILFVLRGIQAMSPFPGIIPHMTGLSMGFCVSWFIWYLVMYNISNDSGRTFVRHLRKNGMFSLVAIVFHFVTFKYFELEILTDSTCAWLVLNFLMNMYLFYFWYKVEDDAVICPPVDNAKPSVHQTNLSQTGKPQNGSLPHGSISNGNNVLRTDQPRSYSKNVRKIRKSVTEVVMKHAGYKRKAAEDKLMDMLLCENYATRLYIVAGDSTNSPLGEFVTCLKDSIVHSTSMEGMMQHLSTRHGYQVTNIAEAFLDENSMERLESYKAMHMQVKDVDCDKAAFLYCLECICNSNALCCKDIGNFLQMHKKLRLTHGDQSDPMDIS